MPAPIAELVGKPFVGQYDRLATVPTIIKAVDITDVCRSKFGGRSVVAYAVIEERLYVAFIVCTMNDPLDGVCASMRVEYLSGKRGFEIPRSQLTSFARILGLPIGVLVELALMHLP